MKTSILIVEDTEAIRNEITAILGFEGFETISAGNGRDGVELARAKLPDLVISDVMMPGLDGFGFLQAMRSHPDTAHIPVLLLTARTSAEDLRNGMNLGADDYLTKPFAAPQLVKAVRTRLEKRFAVAAHAERLLLGRFVRVLPHEFRTPLNGILGFSRLIEEDAESLEPREIRELVAHIILSGERLERSLLNFLLYSRLSAASGEWPIGDLLGAAESQPHREIPSMLAQKAKKERREADVDCCLAPATLPIEPADLLKMVEELVDNAFKFSHPGDAVRITGSQRGDRYLLEVSDQGRGMTENQIEQIDAYRQFDRDQFEQQGCGLGLFLARRLAVLHGGHLTVRGKLEKGTAVCLDLPLASKVA